MVFAQTGLNIMHGAGSASGPRPQGSPGLTLVSDWTRRRSVDDAKVYNGCIDSHVPSSFFVAV